MRELGCLNHNHSPPLLLKTPPVEPISAPPTIMSRGGEFLVVCGQVDDS